MKKNNFCLFLAGIQKKKPGYVTSSYEHQSEIINTYMLINNICGLDARLALESIYKAYIKEPEVMLMEGV